MNPRSLILPALLPWVAAILSLPASADETLTTFFADNASFAYGATAAKDTEVVRSGSASWRVDYGFEWDPMGMNALDTNIPASDLTPYEDVGWFQFYYRSSAAGTIRFAVVDPATGETIFGIDRSRITFSIAATDEWTLVTVPFTGWQFEPTPGPMNWQFIIRAWGGMTSGATVHYDDLSFVYPSGPIPAQGVSLDVENINLHPGDFGSLTASVLPGAADNQGVSWNSSDPSIATVTSAGLVEAVGLGKATITVTSNDGGYTDTAQVTVSPSPDAFPALLGATSTGNPDSPREYHSDWFGTFRLIEDGSSWIRHAGMGWLYMGNVSSTDSMWMWSAELNEWFFTDASVFPFIYVNKEGWSYYYNGPDLAGSYRYDYAFERWFKLARLQHPYLYFSAEDIPAIRARFDSPGFAARKDSLLAVLPRILEADIITTLEGSRDVLGNASLLAFAYIITGEEKYARRAIENALASADLTPWYGGLSWNRGADLGTADRGVSSALVYDWCYDVMTDQERQIISESLHSAIDAYLLTLDPTLPDNWWTYHPMNNWRGVCHGGSTVAALSLFFESPRARQAAREGFKHVPPSLQTLHLADSGRPRRRDLQQLRYRISPSRRPPRCNASTAGWKGFSWKWVTSAWALTGTPTCSAPIAPSQTLVAHDTYWQSGLYGVQGFVEGGPSSLRSALYDSIAPGGDTLLRWSSDNGGQRFYWHAASPFWFLWRRDAPPPLRTRYADTPGRRPFPWCRTCRLPLGRPLSRLQRWGGLHSRRHRIDHHGGQ